MTSVDPTLKTLLATQISDLLPNDGVMPTSMPGLTVMRTSHTSPRQPIIYTPCIYVVAQGSKQGYLDDEVFTYDALHYLILTVPLPLEAHVIAACEEEPYLAIRLDIDLAQLNQLLIEMDDKSALDTDRSSRGIFISAMNNDLAHSMSRLLDTLNDKQRSKVLGPSIVKELLFHVLCGEQGHLLKSFAQSHRHDHQIATVIHYIQENFSEAIEIADLANVANMSESSLHQHFKNVTRLSPIQYIKSIRLHQAKRIIFDDALSISEAAFKVGYASPSQFSREYKRLFGIAPSQELRSHTVQHS